MRVLVTGSRQFLDRACVNEELGTAFGAWYATDPDGDVEEPGSFVVVHGNAPGADTLANDWVWDNRATLPNIVAEPHPVNWSPLGYYDPNQGKARNIEMLRTGVDLILAFFALGAQNRGTRHCVEAAKTWAPDVELREFWR